MNSGRTPVSGPPARVASCEVGPVDGRQNPSPTQPVEVKAEFVVRPVDAGHTVVESAGFVHPRSVHQLPGAEDLLPSVTPVVEGAMGGAPRRGVTADEVSAGGLGGRPPVGGATGNPATGDLPWMLHGPGIDTGVDLTGLAGASLWMADRSGRSGPSRTVTAPTGSVRR